MALTDHDAVYGAMPFVQAAKRQGIQPIFGTEITLEGNNHLTLLVENKTGWQNLCYLITCARHNAPKGKALLPLHELENHTDGLIALSGCRNGEVSKAILDKHYAAAESTARQYRDWFTASRFWIELNQHLLSADNGLRRDLVALATHLKVGYAATNNVHYVTQDKSRLQDVLVCIRHNKTIDEARLLRRPNSEYYLKSPQQMQRLFSAYPDALTNTLEIAARCQFEFEFGLQDLPTFPTPNGLTSEVFLRALCEQALRKHSFSDIQKAVSLLRHELKVIESCGLANYFLIVADIVDFARKQGISCQGRGSAANSLVAFLLEISPVDPLTHDLVFERFLSEERVSVPDIDLDFQADRREEVIQYVYSRYSIEHAAMAATFITYRGRSAIRDVGKALGIPQPMLENAALALDRGDTIHAKSEYERQFVELCKQIEGLPRHLGIHNGGMVITASPIAERLPTEPATLPNRFVVQWDKGMLERAGIVKIDLLGLRMLSAIREAMSLVEQTTGEHLDLSQHTFDDPAIFKMITAADTIGAFQVESRAQAQTLPQLIVRKFTDIIISISLIRPGPVQGNMVHPFLRRRKGEELPNYVHPLLEGALEETLGVILFQEQVIKVARDLAGFTAGQGEELRRGLGGKRPEEEVEKLREAFINGAIGNDVLEEVAESVFESLQAFGGYSFPKSHAAAFAVLVYQSAWLKFYFPAQFAAALLSHQPMGFWTPAVLVNDARRHGISVSRVDVNKSTYKCRVEGKAIRLGLQYISGVGEAKATKIEAARQSGKFSDLFDFCKRTKLPRRLTENLIIAGAMDEWGIDRRKLLWELGNIGSYANGLNLTFPDDGVRLQPLSEIELMILETQVMGLSTGEHIMNFYDDWMAKHRILGSRTLQNAKHGQIVEVAGQTVMHQAPPTAKGYHFITLEDKDGMINVVVRPSIYKQYRYIIRHAPLLWVSGKLQREGNVINILCEQARNLPRLGGAQ